MKITPDFIPHNKFHEGSWLLPIKRPNWYYFKKQKNKNIISNKNFHHTLDEPLKELVTFLHKKRIKTTPSCTGHNFKEKKFKKIYDSLKEDEKNICNNGLVLEDCETGKFYTYQNKYYRLPWNKKTFLLKVMNYQKKGVIGIKLKNEKMRREFVKLNSSEVKIKAKDSILFIFVRSKNGNNLSNWKKITKKVKRILRSSSSK